MMTNVGLDTSSAFAPSPAARPRTNAVFPAPRSPKRSTHEPESSVAARFSATANVSRSDRVSKISVMPPVSGFVVCVAARHPAPGGQLENGVAEMRGEVAGRHGNFPFVGLGEIAGERMKVHGNPACGFGIEQLRKPGGDDAGKDVPGPCG